MLNSPFAHVCSDLNWVEEEDMYQDMFTLASCTTAPNTRKSHSFRCEKGCYQNKRRQHQTCTNRLFTKVYSQEGGRIFCQTFVAKNLSTPLSIVRLNANQRFREGVNAFVAIAATNYNWDGLKIV